MIDLDDRFTAAVNELRHELSAVPVTSVSRLATRDRRHRMTVRLASAATIIILVAAGAATLRLHGDSTDAPSSSASAPCNSTLVPSNVSAEVGPVIGGPSVWLSGLDGRSVLEAGPQADGGLAGKLLWLLDPATSATATIEVVVPKGSKAINATISVQQGPSSSSASLAIKDALPAPVAALDGASLRAFPSLLRADAPGCVEVRVTASGGSWSTALRITD